MFQELLMSESTPRKLHPLILAAAVSITIFSLLASAAITGLIPTGREIDATARTAPPLSSNSVKDQSEPGNARQINLLISPQFAVDDPVRVVNGLTSRI
jgi:hypothetical protein